MATFGDTNVEASSAAIGGGSLQAYKVTSPADAGTLTDLNVNEKGATNGQTVYLCLYADDAGGARPGTLLVSGTVTVTTVAAWRDLAGLGFALSPNTNYWIALFNPTGNTSQTVTQAVSGGTNYFINVAGATPPNPAPAGGSANVRLGSAYATYTPSGGTTVSGVGAIQSAEAFGTPDLLRVLADIGIASAEAFGKADVLFVLSPVAAASGEAFGVPDAVRVLAARAVTSGEAFGLPHVVRLLYPLGIGSAEAIGRPTIVGGIQGPYTITGVGAIASREAFGNTDRLIRLLGPAGVVSGQAFGVAHVTRLLFPLGAVSAGAFGRPSLGPPPVVLLFVGGRADLNDGALYAVSLADGAVYQVLVSDVAVRDLLASDGL